MEIKNRYTGEVIFSGDYETMRLCIEAALSDGKNLSLSNLSGSDLSGIGCFWGDTDEAAAAIIKEYGENSLYEKIMRLNAEALK